MIDVLSIKRCGKGVFRTTIGREKGDDGLRIGTGLPGGVETEHRRLQLLAAALHK